MHMILIARRYKYIVIKYVSVKCVKYPIVLYISHPKLISNGNHAFS